MVQHADRRVLSCRAGRHTDVRTPGANGEWSTRLSPGQAGAWYATTLLEQALLVSPRHVLGHIGELRLRIDIEQEPRKLLLMPDHENLRAWDGECGNPHLARRFSSPSNTQSFATSQVNGLRKLPRGSPARKVNPVAAQRPPAPRSRPGRGDRFRPIAHGLPSKAALPLLLLRPS